MSGLLSAVLKGKKQQEGNQFFNKILISLQGGAGAGSTIAGFIVTSYGFTLLWRGESILACGLAVVRETETIVFHFLVFICSALDLYFVDVSKIESFQF